MVLTTYTIAALVFLSNASGFYERFLFLLLLLGAIDVFFLLFDVAVVDAGESRICIAAERPVCDQSMFRGDHLLAHGRPVIHVA